MFKYLDLCVELKKSHIAKEGLFQYRNMFQSVNVSSLENVIRGYLRTAEERTEAAREQSQQAVIDIDDLDMLATPESLLLSAVSGEDAQDRSDRTILTPWVKFLWESYCQCLELLRTNAHVENLYHDIGRMAFAFCLKYGRKTEFRKLCDKLRKHLEDISKLPAQAVNVSIHRPETQQLNLDTRLVQLDSAIQMELWQEAYKAIEDIHGLMNLSKKLPVPKTMANYYQKLAMVFWKAGNYLFHAAALFKLFQLSKEMKKNITPEELQRMACRVLLATLSIPLPSAHPEFDRFIETDKSPLEKAQRLAILLGLSQPPTRASLLRDILRLNVVSLASPQLQELYLWLEVEFHPLLLCKRVNEVTQRLAEEDGAPLQQYVRALQDVTLVRLIRQVSQVYQTVRMDRFMELAVFATPFHLERLLVDCVRHNDMQIRIDHGSRCINFGMDLSEAQREDHPEGPTLQSMPSEQVRNQLINMACVLHKAMNCINPTKKRMEREKLRAQMVQHYHETKNREHQRILARHKIIEDRKEYLERLNTVREEEEARRLEELARQQLLAEQKRLEQEREERERKRQENEIQQIKDRHLKEKMQQISQTSHGQKILKKLDEDDIKKLDAEQIAAREAEELQKEKRELMQKLKSQEKKVDYFERAKRVEEVPLLQKSFEEKQVQDRNFWEQQETERIQLLVEERELAVQHRERLARMQADKEAFLEKLRAERRTLYMEKLKEFEKMLEEEREKRLVERKLKRKEERRVKWIKEREEEEQRKKEEEERQKQEEERLKQEEEERKEKQKKEQEEEEYRKQREILDRQAEKQRQREAEAEERRLEQEKLLLAQTTQSSSWRQGRGAVPPPPVQLRDKEPVDPPAVEKSNWRKGDGPPPSTTRDEPPRKTDAWRPMTGRVARQRTMRVAVYTCKVGQGHGSSCHYGGGCGREHGDRQKGCWTGLLPWKSGSDLGKGVQGYGRQGFLLIFPQRFSPQAVGCVGWREPEPSSDLKREGFVQTQESPPTSAVCGLKNSCKSVSGSPYIVKITASLLSQRCWGLLPSYTEAVEIQKSKAMPVLGDEVEMQTRIKMWARRQREIVVAGPSAIETGELALMIGMVVGLTAIVTLVDLGALVVTGILEEVDLKGIVVLIETGKAVEGLIVIEMEEGLLIVTEMVAEEWIVTGMVAEEWIVTGMVAEVALIATETVEEEVLMVEDVVLNETAEGGFLTETGIVEGVVLTETGIVEGGDSIVTQEEVDSKEIALRTVVVVLQRWVVGEANLQSLRQMILEDERKPAAAPVRAPVKDSGPPRSMPPGPDDRRKDAPPAEDKKRDEKAKLPQRDEDTVTPKALAYRCAVRYWDVTEDRLWNTGNPGAADVGLPLELSRPCGRPVQLLTSLLRDAGMVESSQSAEVVEATLQAAGEIEPYCRLRSVERVLPQTRECSLIYSAGEPGMYARARRVISRPGLPHQDRSEDQADDGSFSARSAVKEQDSGVPRDVPQYLYSFWFALD
ncbi:hypothetical protein PR048_018850 [Dryococelus australis]|uniref:Eukaryotic translation initiation factor 3 subunit A n=1 Tax=Dryococelus australis TaxID=614101 RepID=A0ABQ9H263_9NEOP|nr:hypothetical protein PR048_018850 [Dryococelus australis]